MAQNRSKRKYDVNSQGLNLTTKAIQAYLYQDRLAGKDNEISYFAS